MNEGQSDNAVVVSIRIYLEDQSNSLATVRKLWGYKIAAHIGYMSEAFTLDMEQNTQR